VAQVKIAGMRASLRRMMNMRLSDILSRWRLGVLLALSALAILVWGLTSKPVLLEVGTEVSILNPLRSRAPERVADVFLRAASNAKCTPDLDKKFCKFVTERPLRATGWRLVNRWDSARGVELFYRLTGGEKPANNKECLIGYVHLNRTGATWRVTGYGVGPGACNGGLKQPQG